MKNNLTILCYHGVTKFKSYGIENSSGKHIDIKKFKQQANFLKNNCHVLSINEVNFHLENKIPFKNKSVMITFDDGFANNFTVAAPILKKNNLPAIFYICPKNIEDNELFWVDKIECCINHTKFNEISIKYKNKLNYFNLSNAKNKKLALKKIKQYCKSCSDKIKNDVILQLINASGINPDIKYSKNYEIAKWSQINKVIKSKLFSIGGHSFNHSIMTKISKKQLSLDISKTISLIKKRLNIRICHYSYPEGQKDHFNKKIIFELKKNMIKTCPTAINGSNNPNTDPFLLKRSMVGFNKIKFPIKGL
jgi:peptidoglycan/xylan/chitin deacetylase (PgdA/CDA1 family)